MQGSELSSRPPQPTAWPAKGSALRQAYAACPVCSPSRAALMTGKIPGARGLHRPHHRHRQAPLPAPMAASSLRRINLNLPHSRDHAGGGAQAGSATVSASMGKWHSGLAGLLAPQTGFRRQRRRSHPWQPVELLVPLSRRLVSPGTRTCPTSPAGGPANTSPTRLTDEADCTSSETYRNEPPFFLYLAHYAVHTPLQAPPGSRGEVPAKVG